MRAALLIIGNEILSGRTRDANLPYLAERLTERGIRLAEARVVPDLEAEIIAAVDALRARYDYVFTTGGIGPTHDDITSAAIAKAFGLPLVRHPEAVRRLEAYYPPGQLNEARLKMAETPEGAELIDNPVSVAPGYRIGNVYVMAGIPRIMQAMLDGIVGRLAGGPPIATRVVATHLPEGTLAAGLAAVQDRYKAVEIGSYPGIRDGKPSVSLVLRGTDEALLDEAADAVARLVEELGDRPRRESYGATNSR